jgi:hypothetical protein
VTADAVPVKMRRRVLFVELLLLLLHGHGDEHLGLQRMLNAVMMTSRLVDHYGLFQSS